MNNVNVMKKIMKFYEYIESPYTTEISTLSFIYYDNEFNNYMKYILIVEKLTDINVKVIETEKKLKDDTYIQKSLKLTLKGKIKVNNVQMDEFECYMDGIMQIAYI